MIAAGVSGYFGGQRAPQVFAAGGKHGGATTSHGPALVDDGTAPSPRLAWLATFEGDGTVSWASGRLPGVPVWRGRVAAARHRVRRRRSWRGARVRLCAQRRNGDLPVLDGYAGRSRRGPL